MSCNESTLMLKCGLLVGNQAVGDFSFISWFYGQQKPYIRQQTKAAVAQTLRERLKTVFPDIAEPFKVVFIDDFDDKIVLPIDDIKETVTALRCFGYLSSMSPIQIFVQVPDLKNVTKDESKAEERTAKIRCCEDGGQIIASKLCQLESTIHNLGQRIVVLLEDLAVDSKSAKEAKSVEIPILRQETPDAINSTDSNLNSQSSEIRDSSTTTVRSRTSSSSSFSVQSHSDHSGEREEGWTRVNGEMNGIRRRRLTTESSCASHRSDYSQDGILRSMEDEMCGFNRFIAGSPDGILRSMEDEMYGLSRSP